MGADQLLLVADIVDPLRAALVRFVRVDLRLYGDGFRSAPQLASVDVKRMIGKDKLQSRCLALKK